MKLVKEIHKAQSVTNYNQLQLKHMTVMCDMMAEEIGKISAPAKTAKEIIEQFAIRAHEKVNE